MSEIRVDTFKAEDGISAPSFPNGIQVTGVVTATVLDTTVPFLNAGSNVQLGNAGVVTATSFSGNLVGGTVSGTTGTFSGNVSVGGTLTYEDVTNIDSVGLVTAREGIFIPDTKEIKIGQTSGTPDLKIYSDGTNGFIREQGPGTLYLQGINLILENTSGDNYFAGVSGAEAIIYHNGNPKLQTSNTGVTVTGTVAATAYTGDGSALTGISVGIQTEALVKTNGQTALLDLSKDDHKVTATGTVTIDVTGGTEADSHTLRIVNSGIATVGFSTYFLFPSGGTPNLPTASGAISLISFTVHRAGASGISTQLISGASVNFS